MNTIGVRLRELRQSAKLSQAKVAAIVGSRQSAVARFESGEAHVPAEVMIRYADYFDVSLDYIFGRTDKPQGKLNKQKTLKSAGAEVSVFRIWRAICIACDFLSQQGLWAHMHCLPRTSLIFINSYSMVLLQRQITHVFFGLLQLSMFVKDNPSCPLQILRQYLFLRY